MKPKKFLEKCSSHVRRRYNTLIAARSLVSVTWYIAKSSLLMHGASYKRVKTPAELALMSEKTYWFDHSMEQVCAELNEHTEERGAAFEKLLDKILCAVWRYCNAVNKRSISKIDDALRGDAMFLIAEQNLRSSVAKELIGEMEEEVMFLLKHHPTHEDLAVVCDPYHSAKLGNERINGYWVAQTKRFVYEALVEEQRVPSYLAPSNALPILEKDAENLFKALYFGGSMGFSEAHSAAKALTA